MIYVLVLYALLDFGWDIFKSRRAQRANAKERAVYNLLYLLHKLEIKSATPQLEERWARRMAERARAMYP